MKADRIGMVALSAAALINLLTLILMGIAKWQ